MMKGFVALLLVFAGLIAGLQPWPVDDNDDDASTAAAAAAAAAVGPRTGCHPETIAGRYKSAAGYRDATVGPRRYGSPGVDRGEDTAAAGKTLGTPRAVRRRGQSRTALSKIEKFILIAMNAFFEKMEMAGHVAAFKMKYLFKTLIKPLI
ncbi:Hypothetical protein CINCED_3A005123 [Cinara cedri]|uniref:Uncharacterized protein n=1 Tax=Cinara cedri TaxID=506608 RepID=A0A5E4NMH2_9HEMI|nr:Hypothetical protein CINCED_3A005123 [Cinara cedri]